jgi:GT2 family glycosyltransferase
VVNKSVAIVILNYNGRNFLKQFLPSVLAYSADSEIIVADNASTDDSLAVLKTDFPSVRIVALEQNHGFAGGYNEALKQIEAEYYVLLNSDVEVTPNWVSPIIDFFENNPTVAAIQPKILAFHQKTHFEYAGAAGGMIDWLGYPFCRGRIFDSAEEDKGQYDESTQIFWATGACHFVRSKVFHNNGGFDASFFAHMEEIDFCWRLQLAGHSIYCVPSSTVFHVGGGTLHKSNPRKTFLNFRNGLLMMYKNVPAKNRFFIILFRMILDGITGIKFLSSGNYKDCLAIIKAHFAFYGFVLKGVVKANPSAQKIAIVSQESIVWNYFVKGKKRFLDL